MRNTPFDFSSSSLGFHWARFKNSPSPLVSLPPVLSLSWGPTVEALWVKGSAVPGHQTVSVHSEPLR